MRLNRQIRSLIFVTLAAMGALAQSPAGTQPRHPNVLLILTDDQGWGDLRVNGNEKIDTPSLDKLAAQSVSFERFFVSPLCAPTRASLLTGRYSQRTGALWVTRGLETMRSEEVTIAEALKQAGYATGVFGKWHNGAHYPHHPLGQGFDEFFGFCGGHWNNYFDTTLEHNGRQVQTKGYITDVLTGVAIKFIERNRARPFFAYVPYNAPHKPLQVPDRYFDKYKQRGFDDALAGIYGMVENVDDNVGRLLRKLDELKLAENTIVVYLHDNGPNGERYNGGMMGRKGSVHEGGVRSPLFIRLPERWSKRVQPGAVVKQIAAHIDLFPTLIELCGAPMPKTLPPTHLDGVSLAPLLKGEVKDWPDRMLFTYHFPNPDNAQRGPGSVRTGQYRLVKTIKGVELYDMLADPNQRRDIAAAEAQVVEKLGAAYEAWLKDVMMTGPEQLPIPVGYAEAPLVELPAPEVADQTGVAFKGKNGWAHDWLTGWDSTDDAIAWDMDVVREGNYEVSLLYTCPQSDVGSKVRVEAGGQKVEGILARAHDPAPLPSPDREPCPEVYEKVWATLRLGEMKLNKGRARLTVKAVSVAGKAVGELKAVRLQRIE